MNDTPPLRRRHPALAFIGGQLTPGLGFLLTGRPLLALLTWAILAAAILVLPLLIIDGVLPIGAEYLLSAHYLFFSVGCFVSAIVAGVLAVRDPPRRFTPYEGPWLVLGFVVLSFATRHALWSRVLDARVVSYGLVPETSMAPTYDPWSRVSIIKRGFQPHKLAINDIVAVRAGAWKKAAPSSSSPSPSDASAAVTPPSYPGITRVIATAGNTVVVDDNGAIFVDGFPVVRTPCSALVPHNGLSCTMEKQATPQGAVERPVTSTSFPRTFTATSVGVGQVFVLPDDRGRKLDAPAGLVAVADVLGRVVPVR